jgi:plasmid stabilization system protein ParE
VRVNVVLTSEARADLAQAAAWYRERSIRVAEAFLCAVTAALTRIETNPTSQVVVDKDTGSRRALLRRFPYRVIYVVDGTTVVVIAVIHHRRDEPVWRGRLPEDQ